MNDEELQLVDCPAFVDQDCTQRCGLPSEVMVRSTWESTDGPVEAMLIKRVLGHWFNGTVESLTY